MMKQITLVFFMILYPSLIEFSIVKAQNETPLVVKTAFLNVSVEEAFNYFTTDELLEKWLTVQADVDPKLGGGYELYWRPETPEDYSTIGCKILSIDAPYYLMFNWKGPVQFKNFMNNADPLTTVAVFFIEMENRTKVTLIHSGWRTESNWEEARLYFDNAWSGAFKLLEKTVNI